MIDRRREEIRAKMALMPKGWVQDALQELLEELASQKEQIVELQEQINLLSNPRRYDAYVESPHPLEAWLIPAYREAVSSVAIDKGAEVQTLSVENGDEVE